MLPLPLTVTERRLLRFAVWPAAVAGLVAAAYVLCAFLALVDTDDPWGATASSAVGFAPTWLVVWVALSTHHRLADGWVDTRIVAPTALWLGAGALLVVLTTDYRPIAHLDPWCVASALPAVSAAAAAAAFGLTLRRRWIRRDASRWTPGAAR